MKKKITKLLVILIALLGTSFFAQSILIGKKEAKIITKDSVKKQKITEKTLVITDSATAYKGKFKPYKKNSQGFLLC